jgi:hypothetical protein
MSLLYFQPEPETWSGQRVRAIRSRRIGEQSSSTAMVNGSIAIRQAYVWRARWGRGARRLLK